MAATPWRIAACAAAALSVVAAAVLAQPANRSRTEAQARRATERLRVLQREADSLASEERTLLNDLRRLELERQIKAEDLRRANEEAAGVASEFAATTERIDQLEQQDLAERPDLRQRLIGIYKLGRGRYLRLLLSTADVRQLGRASRMVGALAQMDRERVAAHQRTIESLRTARTQLEERGRQLQSLSAEGARAAAALDAAARARGDLVRDIDRRRDLNAQLAGELQAAQQKLQLTLRDLSSGAAAPEPAALPLRVFQGALDWPATGQVRRKAGGAAAPPMAGSSGIEIAAAVGSSVQAVHDGLVAFADPFSGFGNLVILDHGGQTFSLYGNLQELAVKRGARVERGQPVGRVGLTPVGAAGLYFELRVDGRPVDPLQWLKKR